MTPDLDPLGDDPRERPDPDDDPPPRLRSCLGWAAYDGPCGDCATCSPGRGDHEPTEEQSA